MNHPVARSLRWAAAALAVLSAVGLVGCGGGDAVPGPGAPHIDVDTPQLRALKAEAGIEPCRSGERGSDLPAVTLSCLGGGRAVDLSTLDGPLLLNFWSSS